MKVKILNEDALVTNKIERALYGGEIYHTVNDEYRIYTVEWSYSQDEDDFIRDNFGRVLCNVGVVEPEEGVAVSDNMSESDAKRMFRDIINNLEKMKNKTPVIRRLASKYNMTYTKRDLDILDDIYGEKVAREIRTQSRRKTFEI